MNRRYIISLAAFFGALASIVSCGEKPGPNPDPVPVGDVKIEDFRILYEYNDLDDSASFDLAYRLQDLVKARTEKTIKVYNSKVSRTDHEIILGRTCLADAEAAEFYGSVKDDFAYRISFKGGKIYICAGGSWALKAAVEAFDEKMLAGGFAYLEGKVIEDSVRGKALFPRCEGSNLRVLDQNIWQYDGANNAAAWAAVGEDCTNAVRVNNFVAMVAAYDPDIWTMQEYSDKMKKLMEPELAKLGFLPARTSTDYTPIYYRTSALELVNVNYAKYDVFTGSGGNIDPGVSKSYTIAVFKHKATGRQFMMVSTHLWWKSESAQAGSDACRYSEAVVLRSKINELLTIYKNIPVLVVGDMNCKIGSAAMNEFTNNSYQPLCRISTQNCDGSNGWHPCDCDKFSREYNSTLDKFNSQYPVKGKHDPSDQGKECIDQFFLLQGGSPVEIKWFERVHAYFTIKLADHYPNFADIKL